MKLLKALCLFFIILMALIVGVLFSARNSQAVSLDVIFFQLPPLSIAILLLLSLATGMFLSAFIYILVTFKLKRHNLQLQRQLSKVKQAQAVNGASR